MTGDELDPWLAEQMNDEEFAYWYRRISAQLACSHPRPLRADGHEYQRRQRARRKRRR